MQITKIFRLFEDCIYRFFLTKSQKMIRSLYALRDDITVLFNDVCNAFAPSKVLWNETFVHIKLQMMDWIIIKNN